MTTVPAAASPPLPTVRHTLDVFASCDARRGVAGLGIVLRAPGARAGRILEEHAEAWSRVRVGEERAAYDEAVWEGEDADAIIEREDDDDCDIPF